MVPPCLRCYCCCFLVVFCRLVVFFLVCVVVRLCVVGAACVVAVSVRPATCDRSLRSQTFVVRRAAVWRSQSHPSLLSSASIFSFVRLRQTICVITCTTGDSIVPPRSQNIISQRCRAARSVTRRPRSRTYGFNCSRGSVTWKLLRR